MHITLDWGEVASLKYSKAFESYKAKDYTKAKDLLEEGVEKESDKDGFFALGQVYLAMEDHIKAVQFLLEAVKIDKFFHEAFSLLGSVYLAHGQRRAAIESFGQAVAIDPTNEAYKQNLIKVVSNLKFSKVSPNLKGVLIECMESDQAEMLFMGAPWLSMVVRDASVGPFYKLAKQKGYKAFKKSMVRFPNCDGLIDPFFLTGLGKFIVPSLAYENWIKFLRHYVLESVANGKSLFTDVEDIDLITCALCRYSFLSDYIIPSSSEEDALLEVLEARVNKAGANPILSELACYGCYKPIYALPQAKEIINNLRGGNHVSQILKSQIEEYFAQQEIANEIESIGSIEDDVSRSVQAQYEAFPYPRWNVAAKDLFDVDVEGHLKDKGVEILIAGCGTGKEAVQMAYTFPDAKITAVDLSKTSLAYAIFKARQLALDNIQFYQADIMNLVDVADWQGRFDYIASAGVLHHMKDPKAGWKVLCGLLKRGGLMRIGLYSRHARWAVNEARGVIQEKDIGSDGSSISGFRTDVTSHLKHKTTKKLEKIFDYYNLSECRDLLFHVQEHQFDLLQVKEYLDTLKLDFLKFYMDAGALAKYKKQNAEVDPEGTNLEVWNRFERKTPNLFIAMYNFWCKKPD